MKKSTTEDRITELMARMTLLEKVGQMNQYSDFWEVTGPKPQDGNPKARYEHLLKGLVGSMLNVSGVEKVRKLQQIAVNETRLGIPLLFGFDVIHGHKTLSPIPLAESASWDLDAIEASARVAAIEASAVGLNWTFAPMIDISRDARWGRIMEGGGEDPYLSSLIGVARIKGFQGNDLSANDTIAACAKHLAGYGFAEAGRDYNMVSVGPSVLYNIILPPFKAAVQAGVRTVMNAFNTLNGIPATGNDFLQRDLLKGEWNFDGFVVSDWASILEMTRHGFVEDLKGAALKAVRAGSDMDMESSAYVAFLAAAVETGAIKESLIDEAVRRILRVKFELGLFDDPFRYCDEERERRLIYHPRHQAAVHEMAKKSIVLLKNEAALLPLKVHQKNIAVIGALANDKTSPLGSWRIGSEDGTAISVLEGIAKYTDQYKYEEGAKVALGTPAFTKKLEINNDDTSGFENAVQLAKESEVVIMVLGEHGFHSGEGRCRTDLNLPGVQQALLKAVHSVNPNIILVLMNGRPLTLCWEDANIPAILETWHLGSQSGHAIADVLFGKHNPGAKLPVSFPRSVGQVPIYYNHYNTGRGEQLEEVFWSHYTDERNDPLYPFGFGLSYTTFTYSDLSLDAGNSNEVKVTVAITNTGKIVGEEVAQMYIRDRVASVVRPVKELKAFKKVSLQPGEKIRVEFALTEKELGFYDNNGNFIVEAGDFDIMVGGNSRDLLSVCYQRLD